MVWRMKNQETARMHVNKGSHKSVDACRHHLHQQFWQQTHVFQDILKDAEIQQKPTWKLTRAQGMPGAASSKTCWKSMRSSDNSACISDAPLPGPSTPPLSVSLPDSLPPAPLMAPLGELGLSAALLWVSAHLEPVILVCDGSDRTT